MSKKIVAYNIVVIPSKPIARQAIRVSKNLHTPESYFSLGNRRYFPHITIYMVSFEQRYLLQVKQILSSIAKKTKPFTMNHTHYRIINPGYVDIAFTRSKGVAALQKQIIKSLDPLRDHSINKNKLYGLTATQRKNVIRYGFRSVGSNYIPHITFTRFKTLPNSVLSTIPKMNFSFTAKNIGMYLLAEHGTCKKLVEIFPIGK